MRISDWSSDVCSSDLDPPSFRIPIPESPIPALQIVTLGHVFVRYHLGGGPFQRLALLALALGLVDGVDVVMVDAARSNLAPGQHGRLVVVLCVVDLRLDAVGELARALDGHQSEFEEVRV